jgi:hypothetical protein
VTEALLVGLGSLLTAILGGVVILINAVHKNRMESRARASEERDVLVQRLKEQLARLDRQVAEQSAVIALCHDAHADSEVAVSDIYGTLLRYYDWGTAISAMFKKAGGEPPAMGPPPARPPRRDLRAEIDFAVRTAQQDEALVRAVGEQTVPARSGKMTRPVLPPLPPEEFRR